MGSGVFFLAFVSVLLSFFLSRRQAVVIESHQSDSKARRRIVTNKGWIITSYSWYPALFNSTILFITLCLFAWAVAGYWGLCWILQSLSLRKFIAHKLQLCKKKGNERPLTSGMVSKEAVNMPVEATHNLTTNWVSSLQALREIQIRVCCRYEISAFIYYTHQQTSLQVT